VHKASVVACLRIQEARRARTEIQRFGTTIGELLQLHRWVSEAGYTHVAIESTSIYWKPVFNVVEGSFELVLANGNYSPYPAGGVAHCMGGGQSDRGGVRDQIVGKRDGRRSVDGRVDGA
jgi:hypothetical protein